MAHMPEISTGLHPKTRGARLQAAAGTAVLGPGSLIHVARLVFLGVEVRKP